MAFKSTLLKHSKGQFMTSIPQDEALTAIKDLTPKAYQLLIYYYSKNDGWNFNDVEIANTLEEVYQRLKSFFLDSERQPTTEAKQEP